MLKHVDNRELFDRVRSSDALAYAELYERMGKPLLIYAYKRLHDMEVALILPFFSVLLTLIEIARSVY